VALKFSACMRSHGYPDFPDPTLQNGGLALSLSPSAGVNPDSPQFQSAQQTCQKLTGFGGP
jgi:hypothetical protein